ncbi:MAG: hypothetical protein ACOCXP_02260 [Candidatus Dojkabacteria bacterium]
MAKDKEEAQEDSKEQENNQQGANPEDEASAQGGNQIEQDQAGRQQSSVRDKNEETANALMETINSTQGNTVITILLSAAVSALLFFFAIAPALSSITSQLEKNEALRERITAQEQKLQSLNVLSGKNQNRASEIGLFNSYVGEDLSQDEIYLQMLEIAEDARMDFNSIAFEVEQPNVEVYEQTAFSPKTRVQTVNLTVTGQLSNLDTLLNELERSTRPYDVRSVQLTNGDEDNLNIVTANIAINTIYWQKTLEI